MYKKVFSKISFHLDFLQEIFQDVSRNFFAVNQTNHFSVRFYTACLRKAAFKNACKRTVRGLKGKISYRFECEEKCKIACNSGPLFLVKEINCTMLCRFFPVQRTKNSHSQM